MDFERQSRKRRLRLFGRARAVKPDLGIGVDRASERDDVVEPLFADTAPVGRGVEVEGHGKLLEVGATLRLSAPSEQPAQHAPHQPTDDAASDPAGFAERRLGHLPRDRRSR